MKSKPRKLPKSVRPEEFKALIRVIPKKDQISRVAFLLGYGSGMRISEVTKCVPENIRENSIFISDTKYGVERVVPIPKGWKPSFTAQLPINRGIRAIQRRFDKYNARAKLNPKYSFHSLRHGFATRLTDSGVPINQVALLLGHSNISTTNVYVRANPIDALKNYEDLF